MRAGLIGRKLGMSQIFSSDGQRVPVTLVEAGPCVVVTTKTQEKHGYDAVQLGFEEMKPSRVSKPEKGQFAKAGVTPRRVVREFRVTDPSGYEVGQELLVSHFETKQFVDITGRSIGKGFGGVMKRWGFGGGRGSHGAHKIHRSGGSIGQCQTPGRVVPGKKMAGHMGDDTVTAQNIVVQMIDVENHLLVVQGSVPGAKGGIVLIKDAVKMAKPEQAG
ncbi:MAG: 50S ribosomal protein L3 [Magnetococcales bacterium]|nr:50S ribosomal protein L3 [Magnetococcales bacterium]